MYKVIIWGTGEYYSQYLNMIKAQEVEGKLQVVAITSDDNYIHKLDTYVFVHKEKINYIDFDYCIVAMKDFQAALREMATINIDENKLIPVRVFSIPYFDFEHYIKIKTSNISIISRNCWGGICYNYFGLKFCSPFVNMYFNDKEFNKFVANLMYYLSLPLTYEKSLYEKI